MKLTPNFSLSEFTQSGTAARMGKVIEPDEEQTRNIAILTYSILQPLRDELDQGVRITSGIRPVWLNKAVGGSKKSAHITGRAADIKVPGMDPADVVTLIRDLELPFDRVIEEFGSWTHIQIPKAGSAPRGASYLAFVDRGGKTRYKAMA